MLRPTCTLIVVAGGILGTFAAPTGSIEGAIYLAIPWRLHVVNLPELLIQTLLRSYVLFQWVTHPEKKWVGRGLWIAFVTAVSLATLGLVASL